MKLSLTTSDDHHTVGRPWSSRYLPSLPGVSGRYDLAGSVAQLRPVLLAPRKRKPDPAETNGWRISRYRYFFYVFIGSFVWYWFPGFIWQSLSVFAFVTWIKPNNAVINQ